MRALAGQALAPLFRKSPEKALRGGLRALVAGELAVYQGFVSRRFLLGWERDARDTARALAAVLVEQMWYCGRLHMKPVWSCYLDLAAAGCDSCLWPAASVETGAIFEEAVGACDCAGLLLAD